MWQRAGAAACRCSGEAGTLDQSALRKSAMVMAILCVKVKILSCRGRPQPTGEAPSRFAEIAWVLRQADVTQSKDPGGC